eukprot:199335_1
MFVSRVQRLFPKDDYLPNDLKFLKFDVDEWTEDKVYGWIESIGIKRICNQNISYLYHKKSTKIKEVKKRTLDTIKEYHMNGRTLQIFEHNDPKTVAQNDIYNNYEWSVLFYAQQLMLKNLFIAKTIKKRSKKISIFSSKKQIDNDITDEIPKRLYINRNTILIANHSYVFDDIYIKNCTLKINKQGLLILKSLNNIILQNATIDLNGKEYDYDNFKQRSRYTECTEYGTDIDKIFVGAQGSGSDCYCGSYGGNGLKLECKKLILQDNSLISTKAAYKKDRCHWGCGEGDSGSCLIICDEIKCESSTIECCPSRYDHSHFNKYFPRIVVNIKNYKMKQMYLIYGYMRKYTIIADICYILNQYLQINFDAV